MSRYGSWIIGKTIVNFENKATKTGENFLNNSSGSDSAAFKDLCLNEKICICEIVTRAAFLPAVALLGITILVPFYLTGKALTFLLVGACFIKWFTFRLARISAFGLRVFKGNTGKLITICRLIIILMMWLGIIALMVYGFFYIPPALLS